ncbi:radical SAM protein [Nocardia abscessus]|uniref:radical SAM protein n=1 Tax=Nocardia abscessus TaxID=120957 RepID=UPI001892E598|nr:radical SAM protein [Nocardia abscessus]MBF6339790.1 radical SAM protein [Nocardia abscessus]
MRYNTLGIHLTNACNLTCGHCITDSSPHARGELTWPQIEAAVRSAATHVDGVCVTGGEALLRRELALRTIRLTRSLGLRSSLVTNGFWARSPHEAKKTVAELVDAGLDKLAVSFDRFHFTPKHRGIRAALLDTLLAAAAATNLELVLQYCGSGDDDAFQIAAQATARHGARLETAAVLPFGRGRNLLLRRGANIEDVPAGPCGVVGRPILTPEGDFYTCCGPARGAPAHSPLRLPIGTSADVGEALATAEVDPIINTIHTQGPKAMLEMLSEPVRERVTQKLLDGSMCSLCRAITDDKEAVSEIRTALAGKEVRLVALSAMLSVAQNELKEKQAPCPR